MGRIREEAEMALSGKYWLDESDAKIQGRRVLLLEKAYWYQRATFCLVSQAWEILLWHNDAHVMGLFIKKSAEYANKAAELYRKAEEL